MADSNMLYSGAAIRVGIDLNQYGFLIEPKTSTRNTIMDIPELKGPSVMMQNILLKWLSCLLCGKAEKRRILLCYHSRDEGNVKKFLKSLHNIKADVIVKNESEARDDDDDYSNFSKGIVLICLSKEYVVSQAFEKGTVQHTGNFCCSMKIVK
uniref:Uncharacterized protein n=1 Tax=Magallana gigas TaxID=29159 RepID=K1QJP4_MAGGI